MNVQTFLLALVIAATPAPYDITHAENLDAEKKALDLITDTANKICNVVPTNGEVNSADVQGKVTAQLNGLASKLADIGVSGSGSIKSETYQNVIRQDLSSTLKDNVACKLKVFDTLQNKLLESASAYPVPHEPKSNANIFAECNIGLWPPTIPQNGKIYFTLIQSSSAPSSLGYFFGAPGSQSSSFGAYKAAYECKLTNYSILPVFDVKISLHTLFREVIVPPGPPTGRASGAVKATCERPLVIQKMDPGKENPFVFIL